MTKSHIKRRNKTQTSGKKQFKKTNTSALRTNPRRDYCSINTPLNRRLQTLIVSWHASSFVIFIVISLFAIVNPFMWWFVVPYAIYFAIDRTPANGNVTKRYSTWFRSLFLWNYFRDYFPITLHKTADLTPTFSHVKTKKLKKRGLDPHYASSSKNKKLSKLWSVFTRTPEMIKPDGPRYIFGYHPHGVAAFGAFSAFGTEACGWSTLFPGIPICLMTLVNQFQIPVYRDYLMALGITSVSRKNAMRVLEKNYSIAIVIGGASESLLSDIGSSEIILHRRKGFVKLALQTGNINLVPVYAFGETDCYRVLDVKDKNWIQRFQMWMKNKYSFTIPLFFARGMFNYDFGLLPFRTPINLVVGQPIYIEEKIENPSLDKINHYHDLYVAQLKKLYDENKSKFGYQDTVLKIVE